MIRGYWKLKGQSQRRKILCRTFAYHGVTLATTSLTGLVNCQVPFDLPLEVISASLDRTITVRAAN